MERSEINQRLLDLYEAPSYLEIGVCEGYTFHDLRARRKVAVDPEFRFDIDAARAANPDATYHALPSDDYFAGPGANDRFDVAFIDGLHTFDQTLRDLLNVTERLNEGGVIIIDDVMPFSYSAAVATIEESEKLRRMVPDGSSGWMGDVYRLVFFLRDYMPSYSYATIQENHGQTVLWRATRAHDADVPPLGVEAISRLEYKDAVFRSRAFNFMPFAAIEQRLRGWKAR